MSEGLDFTLLSRRDLVDHIERLPVSADAKALLAQLATTTVDVAGRIIEVGRRIMSFILDCAQRYPNTMFGLTVGFVIGHLITSVPVLGAVLGPLIAPLLIAFGLAAGALADLKEAGIRNRMVMFEAQLKAMADA